MKSSIKGTFQIRDAGDSWYLIVSLDDPEVGQAMEWRESIDDAINDFPDAFHRLAVRALFFARQAETDE